MRARYFATRNRRSVFVCLIGDWPSRAGLWKACRAGVYLGYREATPEEIEFDRESPRPTARMWPTLLSFIRWHREEMGIRRARALLKGLRTHWNTIRPVLMDSQKKKTKHAKQRGTTKATKSTKLPPS